MIKFELNLRKYNITRISQQVINKLAKTFNLTIFNVYF